MHLGHLRVIEHAVRRAVDDVSDPTLITFEPHPQCILDPANCPQAITTLEERLGLVEQAGIANAIVLRFDREVASLSPDDFIMRLSHVMEIKRWIFGPLTTLGRDRKGDAVWMRRHGQRVDVVPPVTLSGQHLDSTMVRRLSHAGEVDQANRLLGREYTLSGPVEAGAQMGRQLGFPTANVRPEPNKLIPGLGAYAGRVRTAKGEFLAAMSIGYRPTFEGTQLKIEAFLLDFDGDLYHQQLELRFLKWLHPDIKFGSIAELVQQLGKDVAETRRIVPF